MKTSGTNRRAIRNLDSICEEHPQACLLIKQGRRSRLKLHRMLAGFLQPPQDVPQPTLSTCSSPSYSVAHTHPTRAKASMAEENVQVLGMEPAQTWPISNRLRVAITSAHGGSTVGASGTLTGVWGLPHTPVRVCVPWPTLGTPSCSSTSLPWGKLSSAGKGESTHLDGISSDLKLRASAPAIGDLT